MSNNARMFYAGHRRGCGCVVKVSEDIKGAEQITAQEVADMICDGLIVKRVDYDYLNTHWDYCFHSTQIELTQPTLFPVLALVA